MTAPNRKLDGPFGVCGRIGEDLGFNPDWLRLPLAAGMLWNAEVVLAVYAALGLVVLASRLLFPVARPSATVIALPAPPVAVAPMPGAPEDEPEFAYARAA